MAPETCATPDVGALRAANPAEALLRHADVLNRLLELLEGELAVTSPPTAGTRSP